MRNVRLFIFSRSTSGCNSLSISLFSHYLLLLSLVISVFRFLFILFFHYFELEYAEQPHRNLVKNVPGKWYKKWKINEFIKEREIERETPILIRYSTKKFPKVQNQKFWIKILVLKYKNFALPVLQFLFAKSYFLFLPCYNFWMFAATKKGTKKA